MSLTQVLGRCTHQLPPAQRRAYIKLQGLSGQGMTWSGFMSTLHML